MMTDFDFMERAARLYNVPERLLTTEMMRRVVIISLHPPAGGATCPECKQPVTGTYVGKKACTRCNWNEIRGALPMGYHKNSKGDRA